MFFIPHSISAQNFDPNLDSAYQDVLSLKLYEARKIKNLSFNNNKDQAFQVYILSLSDIIELLLVKDDALYQEYHNTQKDYINT